MHPLDILNSIRRQSPSTATHKEMFENFLARIRNDDSAIRELAYIWFIDNIDKIEVITTSANDYEVRPVSARPPGDTVTAAPRPRTVVSPDQKEKEKTAITAWKKQVRVALTMLQIMPNGKELQNCDAGYVRKLGGVFTSLVIGLPDNARIGLHRVEEDLQNICKRFNLETAA